MLADRPAGRKEKKTMRRNKPTPEQIAAAKERRANTRELAKRAAAMSPEEQSALVRNWPTMIETGHRVSLKNAMLIALQGGGTIFGGLSQWRKAGRKVRKGGKSVQIFYPLGLRRLDEQTDGEPDADSPTGYGITSVFDISQTEDAGAEALQRLTEAEARANMAGAYVTTPEGLTHCVEHISERESNTEPPAWDEIQPNESEAEPSDTFALA